MWDIINSRIVLALTTLIFGAFVTSKISYNWQKRKLRYELQVKHIQRLTLIYQKYFRLLRSENVEKLSNDYFDELHTEFLSLANQNRILFRKGQYADELHVIITKFTSIRDRILKGRKKDFSKLLVEIQEQFDETFSNLQLEIIK